MHGGGGARLVQRRGMAYNTLSSMVGKHVVQVHSPMAANTPAAGCSLDDAVYGDEGWKCLCRETDFGLKLEHSIESGDLVNYMIINASERLTNLLLTDGLKGMCKHGRAYNPFERPDGARGTCSMHLPIYKLFAPAQSATHVPESHASGAASAVTGPKALVQEWLGNIRKWTWDCVPNTYKVPYVAFSPMRLVDCVRGMPKQGVDLPVVDEEYFEMADGLLSVAAAPPGGKFVVAEVGARYAPWALRAMVAARRLGRSRELYAIVVDPKKLHVAWVHGHFRLNGFNDSQFKVIEGMAFHGAPDWGKGVNVHTLSDILKDVDHVDLLDVDVQDAEKYILRSADDKTALEQKVMRTHIEVHSVKSANVIIGILRKHGFRILRNATDTNPAFYRHAQLGIVPFRAGYVYAANMRFANTLNGTC